MNSLNYHHLQNFWHVARTGSVRKAAEVLNVTPSTISVQVRALEKSLGVQLFEKQGRGLVLTEIGRRIRDQADEIFQRGNELWDLTRERTADQPIRVRIGISEFLSKLVAWRLLQPLSRPEFSHRLLCREADQDQLIADLTIFQLDFVLSDRPLDPVYQLRAHSKLLQKSRVILMAIPEIASELSPRFPESLHGAPLLLPARSGALRSGINRWLSDLQIVPRICAEFDDSAMMKTAGAGGAGAFVVPEVVQEDAAEMYGVHPIGMMEGVYESCFAIYPERTAQHPAVRRITEFVWQDPADGQSGAVATD